MPPSATVAINELADRLRAEGREIFKLGLGQSPFPVPRPVVEELQANAHQKAYLPAKGLPLRFVLGGADSGLGATTLAEGVSPIRGLVLEIILTFFLVNTIFNAAVSGKAGNLAGLAIGLTLVFCILMGGPLTGASLNPARTLGPALVSGNAAHLWLYFVGPIIGGLLAALLYRGVLKPADD